MNVISRRNMIRASGYALGAPLTFSRIPTVVHAQTSVSSASSFPPLPFSEDLNHYVNEAVGPVIPGVRKGSLSQSQLTRAASCTRLFAKHIESLNVDRQVLTQIQSMDYNSFSSRLDSYQSRVLASALQFDPTIELSDINKRTMSSDQFEEAKQDVASLGLSGVYHLLADLYETKAKHLTPSLEKPAVWNSSQHPRADYGLASKPHLHRVCFKISDSDCKALAKLASIITYVGVGIIIVCLFIPGVDFLCVAVGASVGIHGGVIQLLTDIGCGTWS